MASEPIPVPKAAKLLGVTPEAVRQRIKRGQLEAFRDNRGHWQVILGQSNQQDSAPPLGSTTELTLAKSELARWEERAQQLEKRLADRDRELAELRANHERERADLNADRDRLLALIERMTIEQRSIWQELRAWVARRFRG